MGNSINPFRTQQAGLQQQQSAQFGAQRGATQSPQALRPAQQSTQPQFGMQTLSGGGDALTRFQGDIATKKINPNPNVPALPYTATRDFGLA